MEAILEFPSLILEYKSNEKITKDINMRITILINEQEEGRKYEYKATAKSDILKDKTTFRLKFDVSNILSKQKKKITIRITKKSQLEN